MALTLWQLVRTNGFVDNQALRVVIEPLLNCAKTHLSQLLWKSSTDTWINLVVLHVTQNNYYLTVIILILKLLNQKYHALIYCLTQRKPGSSSHSNIHSHTATHTMQLNDLSPRDASVSTEVALSPAGFLLVSAPRKRWAPRPWKQREWLCCSSVKWWVHWQVGLMVEHNRADRDSDWCQTSRGCSIRDFYFW